MSESRKKVAADANPDLLESEKRRLENEISQLKSLIQIEGKSQFLKFGDLLKTGKFAMSRTSDHRTFSEPLDLNTLFRLELHKFTGFYCAKFDKDEYTFNYRPGEKISPNAIYFVQICKKDDNLAVGKWVMPMGTDMDNVLQETPIDKNSAIVPFLKNWKLHIDCWVQRRSQFHELKDYLSTGSRFTIDSNLSFTRTVLQMFRVYHTLNDDYFDMEVYLFYKRSETIVSRIKIESIGRRFSEVENFDLKAYTKCYKFERLLEAFKYMTDPSNSIYIWDPLNHDLDSELELDDTSDSDESTILDKILSDRKTTKRRKRRSSKGRKKLAIATEEIERISSPIQVSKKKPSKAPSKGRKNVNESGKRLRQTELNFSNKEKKVEDNSGNLKTLKTKKKETAKNPVKSAENTETEKSPPTTKKPRPVGILSARKKKTTNVNQAISSTPLPKKKTNQVKFATVPDVEISPIVKTVGKKFKK